MQFTYIGERELLVPDRPYGPVVLSKGDVIEGPDEWAEHPHFEPAKAKGKATTTTADDVPAEPTA